jgi:preprotein translocase subunit SecF
MIGKLYRGETKYDFVGNRSRGFILSAVLIVGSVAALLVNGLNLGVDFQGGTVVEVENINAIGIADMRDALRPLGLDAAQIQELDSGARSIIRVQTEAITDEEQDRLLDTVSEAAGSTETSLTSVGPTFGRDIASSAVRALVIFLIVIAIFISLRFELAMAAGALAALFHDLIITAGVYAVTGLEVTPATVIAILTILGYSLYDTVVVFDKVSENLRQEEDAGRVPHYNSVINDSMNQVLMRSINTSLTSLLPIASLLVVGSFLLGATTLREFALALFVGVAAGTYSSIFVAAPVLSLWKDRTEGDVPPRADVAAGRDTAAPGKAPDAGPGTGPAPRAPKKRKR